MQRYLFKKSMLLVDLHGKGVMVALTRHAVPANVPEHKREWDLMIDPCDFSAPLRRGFSMEKEYAKELLLVSEHINALLKMIPGVKSLRWFFKGWDPMTPGVQSPAELPWGRC